MKIAIVGGGITGISAAYELSKHNPKLEITLYERSSRLGGLVGSFRLGNVWLEKYFHHIFLSDTAIRELIDEIGLKAELYWRMTPMGYYASNRLFSFNSPMDLLCFSHLSLLDRFRLGFHIFRTGKRPDGLKLDSITVREWVEKSWGGEIYPKFWLPLLKAKFGDVADEISAAWLWGRIYARANSRKGGQEKLGYLRGGFVRIFEVLTERLKAQGVDLLLQNEVTKVTCENLKWKINSKQGEQRFDVVILAVPCPQILSLCPELPPHEKNVFQSISYQAILCMGLVMNRPLSPFYWLNIGDRSIPFAGIIEQTNFIPKEDYGGNHVAYLFNYLPQDHPWLLETKNQIFNRYEIGLKRMFPSYQRNHIQRTMVFKDPYATPIYDLNYSKKMPPLTSSLPGLYYANTAHIFPHDRNMNFSIELAKKLNQTIHNTLKMEIF